MTERNLYFGPSIWSATFSVNPVCMVRQWTVDCWMDEHLLFQIRERLPEHLYIRTSVILLLGKKYLSYSLTPEPGRHRQELGFRGVIEFQTLSPEVIIRFLVWKNIFVLGAWGATWTLRTWSGLIGERKIPTAAKPGLCGKRYSS